MSRNFLKGQIKQDEVEKLINQGKLDDDRVGIFIMKMVGSHNSINNFAARRYGVSYRELVCDGSFFVL